MAIVRTAGTEIIRSIHLENVSNPETKVIIGVQHHIYTVLSITCFANGLAAAGNFIRAKLWGYDTFGGTTAQIHYIFRQDMQLYQTFVWDNKFSFNGYEPIDFTATLDSVAKQDAIADQGSSVAQYLTLEAEAGGDTFDCTVTYIDQNNA